jgi:hypothetical protein
MAERQLLVIGWRGGARRPSSGDVTGVPVFLSMSGELLSSAEGISDSVSSTHASVATTMP